MNPSGGRSRKNRQRCYKIRGEDEAVRQRYRERSGKIHLADL